MLDALKRELIEMIRKGNPEAIFARLSGEVLDSKSSLYSEVILLQGRWRSIYEENIYGRIDYKEAELSFNNVNYALGYLIDKIEPDDLAPNYQNQSKDFKSIPIEQKFTCDRNPQYRDFMGVQHSPKREELLLKNKKVLFLYLHGDEQQELSDFFERLRLEKGGQLAYWREGNFDPQNQPIGKVLKLESFNDANTANIQLRRGLFSVFALSPDGYSPLEKSSLSDIVQDSPILKGLTKADSVFVLISVDDYDWNPHTIPEAIKNLYQEFCSCDLPESSPTFYFFFGVEYEKDNTKVKSEVESAIKQAEHGLKLDELLPVEKKDVYRWVKRNKELWSTYISHREFTDQFFPEEGPFDMRMVSIELNKIIDKHNRGLLL